MATYNKGLTLEEVEALAKKGNSAVKINDGAVSEVEANSERPHNSLIEDMIEDKYGKTSEIKFVSKEEIHNFVGGLSKAEIFYMLSLIDWRMKMDSIAQMIQENSDALDVIYLRSKHVKEFDC